MDAFSGIKSVPVTKQIKAEFLAMAQGIIKWALVGKGFADKRLLLTMENRRFSICGKRWGYADWGTFALYYNQQSLQDMLIACAEVMRSTGVTEAAFELASLTNGDTEFFSFVLSVLPLHNEL